MNLRFPCPRPRLATTVLTLIAGVLATACSVMPSHTPQHSDAWCADAALFSMHAVRSHQLGTSYTSLDHDLDATDVAYQQLYPALSKQDTHKLLHDITAHHRSRFQASQAVVQSCQANVSKKVANFSAPYLAVGHSDLWCAQLMDYGIGIAGYRAMGFPGMTMMRSVFINPSVLMASFPALKPKDMANVVQSVYTQKWSRFQTAAAISHACVVDKSRNDAANIHAPVNPPLAY